ncbi:MAG TPA: PDZ domain-containing protein [Kofleriaceae bacterium]|nr:PDZ domain-containing protein [Kofleriaceae bacterium]
MRRLKALLIAGLVAAPIGAVAGPSPDHPSTRPDRTAPDDQAFDWGAPRPRLGIAVLELTPELRTYFGAPDHSGVLVAHVEPGTPAARAGILVGDVVVDVRGHSVDDSNDIRAALAAVGRGQVASIKVVRDRKPLTLQATLTTDAGRGWNEPAWPARRWMRQFMQPPPEYPGETRT